MVAEAERRLADASRVHGSAAEGWGSFGCPPERAYALLAEARCLLALGREGEARAAALAARAIVQDVGARPLLAEVGELLTRSRAAADA